MVGRRKYDDGCAVAHALDLVGERWALLVVRELLLGPKRFTDLLSGLPGASPDVLTQRLRELAEVGVVRRRRLAPPAASWVYELTSWGAELEPIVLRLARWSSRSPGMRYDAPLGVDSLVLSLMALFDGTAAAGFEVTVGLRLGADEFRLAVADGRLAVSRGDIGSPANAGQPDAVLDTDLATLLTLLRTDRPLADAVEDGTLRLTGDPAVADRFRRLFPAPEPVPVAQRA
ncbi:MAG TPA: helix-turn-helix domain-containing protein [Pseudonocardia sp.]|nr:helix-turn-helix domain-containing protein [Pseudonocardia sp.]